jgi:hypothetical protein
MPWGVPSFRGQNEQEAFVGKDAAHFSGYNKNYALDLTEGAIPEPTLKARLFD